MPPQSSFFSNESRAFELLSSRMGVAHINSDQIIESAQGITQQLALSPEVEVVSQPVSECFVELFGLEEMIDLILAGELPFLELQEVNRPNDVGGIDYFDFGLYPADKNKPKDGLILFIENTTSQGRLMQNVIQQRNELRLTQQELSRANSELHSLNELKSIFLSMAAHDLRSPLSVITTYSDLMLNSADDFENSPFEPKYVFSRILEQSIWLNSLIDDILNLNMIEQGKFPIEMEKIDVQEPLKAVVNQFQHVLATRNISVSFIGSEDAVWAFADKNRIKQIAFNLIGNSAKFLGDAGNITVTVSPLPEQHEIKISFADDGPGIPKQQQERLFELFYRTPGASKFSGTGLGLYIVKTITELLDGEISVESEPGEGTSFNITLPILIVE